MHISIDLETLGTNVDSQIISIGAVIFTMKGQIRHEFYEEISLPKDTHINATPGTIAFWLSQPDGAAPEVLTNKDAGVTMEDALRRLSHWINSYLDEVEGVWANGTKFDLGMLEYQYKKFGQEVPWFYNTDRCMRTLKQLAKTKENSNSPDKLGSVHEYAVHYADRQAGEGVAHNALYDATWQAHYIIFAYNKLL